MILNTLLVLYTPDGKEKMRTTYYYDSDGQVVKKIEYSYREYGDGFNCRASREQQLRMIFSFVYNIG